MRKTRVFAVLLSIVLVISMMAGISLPATAAYSSATEITTAAELIALASGDLSGNYMLMADIDLTERTFSPIGTIDAPFTGTFDGNGYTISGLKLSSNKSYQGLFGVNKGTIRRVKLDHTCSISGSSFVGAIAGYNLGMIEDCISYASVSHSGVAEKGGALKILCQNLSNYGDDVFAAAGETTSRRPGLIQRMKNADPDIIFFQEDMHKDRKVNGITITAWNTLLKNNLTSHTFIGQKRSNSDYEGVTVAYKTSKFNKNKEGIFWLSTNPDATIANQTQAWGSGSVRTAQWVVLTEKTTNQQYLLMSTHFDNVSDEAREKGSKLVADRLDSLQTQYPNAIVIMGGDFNADANSVAYKNIDGALGGKLDDTRYVAEDQKNNYASGMNVNTLAVSTNGRSAIDHIFVDFKKIEVNSFEVLIDTPNNIAPSDHCGLLVSAQPVENNYVGGLVGANEGSLQRAISGGTFSKGSAEGTGAIAGYNKRACGKILDCYAPSNDTSLTFGDAIDVQALPASVSASVTEDLGKYFKVENNQYALIEECSSKGVASVFLNGAKTYQAIGTMVAVNKKGTAGETVFVDGAPFEGSAVMVPQEGVTVSVATPVNNVTRAVTGGDYTVSSLSEFAALYGSKLNYFKNRNVTIHLLCDIDLSNSAVSSFGGFSNVAFSFDGHGHTISNFGTASAPKSRGLFYISAGSGGSHYFRNVTLKNFNIKGYNGAALCSLVCANAGLEGLPREFEISNVIVDSSSMNANGEAQGFLLSRYSVPDKVFNVNITGCQVKNSTLNANEYEHIGMLVGKMRPGSNASVSHFNIRDCYIANNTITNTDGGVGLVCGTSEASNYATFTNIGIFNNTMSGKKGAFICTDNGGSATHITMEKLIIGGNTMNTSSTHLVSCCVNTAEGGFASTTASGSFSELYIDKNMTAAVESKDLAYSTCAPNIESGHVGETLNKQLSNPAFYWAKDGKYYKPATKEGQIRHVTVRDGASVATLYENGGEQRTLAMPASGSSYVVCQGNGSFNSNVFTVGTDRNSVVATARPVSSVTSAVTSGDYTVSSISEWMTLFNNAARFKSADVTIHLLCDIDLSGSAASGFTHFVNPAFSFNGHGHTIKNWGTAASHKKVNGLFYVSEASGGMRSLTNLNFDNCHIGGSGYDSMLYSVAHANAGLEGLPNELTIENIHIKNSTLDAVGECGGFIMTRYAAANTDYTVDIIGCTVENSSMNCEGSAHKGLLVGKPRASYGTEKGTFNIRDCYVGGNTMTNAINGTGLFIGTAEDARTIVNLTNSVAAGNTLTTTGDGALAGYSDGGKVYMTDVVFDGNTLNAATKYVIGTNTTLGALSINEVYSDATALTSTVEGAAQYSHIVAPDYVGSGEIAYDLNEKYSDPALRWGHENQRITATDEDHRAAKVGLYLADGALIETRYATGGITLDLTQSRDPNATFVACNGGSVSGANFTLPTGIKEVVVKVGTQNDDAFLGEERLPITSVTAAVSKGSYSIASLSDWMYLFNHQDYFKNNEITIYLEADLDLSQSAASGFTGFKDALFAFNGLDHTLSNWKGLKSSTTGGNSLFIGYQGNAIKNLKIQGFEVGGGYGRALLIGEYAGNHSLSVENVHISDSILDATASGNQMGFFISRAKTAAAFADATISLNNCSLQGSTMKASFNGSVNNSGLLIGSAYSGFDYSIQNCEVYNCTSNIKTGAGGLLVGALESSGASLTFDKVGVFGCNATVADTNVCPGIFAGTMSQNVPLTIHRSMAAGNTFKGVSGGVRNEIGLYNYNTAENFSWTGTTSLSGNYVDQAVYAVACADNSTGAVASKVAITQGVKVLSANAFKSGEAAWTANTDLNASIWMVRNHGEYPTAQSKSGYAKPAQVTAGEKHYYTNGSRHLSAEDVAALDTNDGIWKKGNAKVTTLTLFVSDTSLTFTAHVFDQNDLQPYGDHQHTATCKNDCGKVLYYDCQMSEFTPVIKGGERYHISSCVCGRKVEERCTLVYTDLKNGTHEYGCKTCGYKARTESCDYSYTHVSGSQTHQGICACGANKVVSCTLEYTDLKNGTHEYGCKTCGYLAKTENCAYTYSHVEGTQTHKGTCACGAKVEADCTLSYTDLKNGTHEYGCKICNYIGQVENCAYSYAHIEGTQTHQGSCACGAKTAPIQCELQKKGTEHQPGEPTYVVYECAQEGCTNGYREKISLMGDANQDGILTIADAVMVLRVINGNLSEDQIDADAANVETTDSGLTTADALMIVRLVLKEI